MVGRRERALIQWAWSIWPSFSGKPKVTLFLRIFLLQLIETVINGVQTLKHLCVVIGVILMLDLD